MFAREHECMAKRADWPLGPALKSARERAGLSARAAASRTKGLVSSGRWYQLESGVQKTKGQEVPIGTTPETVIAAALAVDWDINEALQTAGMSATESAVRAIETKMFGPEVRAPYDEPDWLLYLEAVLEFIDRHHGELDDPMATSLLLECEFLARKSLENQPSLQLGIDQSITYGARLNQLLTKLRDQQNEHLHGTKETTGDEPTESTPTSSAGEEDTDQKNRAGDARDDEDNVTTLTPRDQAPEPERPEDAKAARKRNPRFKPQDPDESH